MYKNDDRIVLTLDAGGTNMVFGAMKGGEFITESITLPSNASNLELCLGTIVAGFEMIIKNIQEQPSAISFAFPGPADYPNGIIGGFLPNFPSFRNGVALGPFLEDKFKIPVFINNDGDLYAYGEAMGGVLPEINSKLEAAGSSKRYKNLIGYTFGTGLGIGIVMDGKLNRGDNSCVETFCLKHPEFKDIIIEDGASIRAVKRVYASLSGDNSELEPKDIADIAYGRAKGDKNAAVKAFYNLGAVAGEAMVSAVTLIDGIICIGGGLMNSGELIIPGILDTMRGKIKTLQGDELNRVQMTVYNLDSEDEFEKFAKGEAKKLQVHGTDKFVIYDPQKRTGIVKSKIGASKAISLGAYMFALNKMDNE